LTAPEKMAGISLKSRIAGRPLPDRSIFSETFYARFHLGWSDLASLVSGRYQYIHAPRPELYDLSADPAEKKDLAPGKPPEFRELHASFSRIERPTPAPGEGDPERARQLAALGYLTAKDPKAQVTDLPDPKDKIGELQPLKEAFGLYSKGEFAKAASLLSALVKQHPSMSDAWQIYAQTLQRLGREDEALAAYRTADRQTPGNGPLLLEISTFLLEAGRLEESKRYAMLAQAAGSPGVHQMLAQIAVAQHDLTAAEAEARLALGERPGRRLPLLILARVARERGDLPGALGYLDEVARRTLEKNLPPLSLANGLRGDVLARLGKDAEAEEAFHREIELFPENPQAWCNLALLYASQGRDELARETLTKSVKAVPSADSFRAAIETAGLLGDRELAAGLAQEAQRRLGLPAAAQARRSTR
jgi:Tfp pilus assembly protein PilF